MPGMANAVEAGGRDVRRVAAFGLAGLAVVPAALSFAVSPAVALPASVGGVIALTLAAAAFVVRPVQEANGKTRPEGQDMPETQPPADSLLDLMPGLVTVHNDRGAVYDVRGRDRDALMEGLRPLSGHGFVDQIHVSDRILFLQALDRLRQGENGAAADIRFHALGDSTSSQFLYRRLNLSALRNSRGDFTGFFTQLQDNTATEMLRQELAARATDVASANEAKSRFLAAVSHELRTPLNAILGFSDILSGEYFGRLENDRQREYVGLINQSGHHLLAVVNTMLDMSKIEAGRYELICEPFAMGEVASACEGMLSLQAKTKGVTLTSRVSRDVGEVVADRRALQQVMINLVGNAIKFTDGGGVVCVDVDTNGKELKITVSDTGIGIPADKIEMLGSPFMQVQNEYSRKYEGTGLGLSLVKGLVALHGGRFEIASELGEGTVITVTLPSDGSGARAVENDHALASTEFPPRLKPQSENLNITKNKNKDESHDHAKAQTA
jgi:two-component system, cell cycle sensor histidine kinase DivJ